MGTSVAVIGTRGYPSYYGGFETAVRKLAPYLVERGWEVTVYGRPGSVRRDDPEVDVRVRSSLTWGVDTKSLSTLTYGLSACCVAAVRRPDVALVMNVANGYFLPLLKAVGVSTVVNVDGIEWEREKWGRLATRVFYQGARLTARHADRIVCDSERIADRWRDEFGVEGAFIPYGADTAEAGEAPLGLVPGRYVLVVARLVPENTISEFLRAAEMLDESTDIVIVGSAGYRTPMEDHVRALVQRRPNVRWLGHVSDDRLLYGLWSHAGAYYHGHSVGGTNPALVQAMAAGAPVVARDTPFTREVLGPDGGLFVEPNPIAIANGLRRMLLEEKLREQTAKSASARVREAYTWEKVCRDYERVLEAAVTSP